MAVYLEIAIIFDVTRYRKNEAVIVVANALIKTATVVELPP